MAEQPFTHVNIQNPRAPLYPPERVLTDRGFADYGMDGDTYGTPYRVRESSAAAEPCVWVFVDAETSVGSNLHLNVDNVRWLRERLGEFLDDVGEAREVATCTHCGAALVNEDCPNYGNGEVHA